MAVLTLGSIGDRLDLQIRQGGTFGPHQLTLTNPPTPAVPPALPVVTPVDLTGCLLRGQIRRKALDSDVLASLVCEITDPTAGTAILGLSASVTAGLPAGEVATDIKSQAVWDLELVDAADNVIPVFYGNVLIFREVTR